MNDFAMTITGVAPVEGFDKTAGVREYDITVQRDGYEDISVARLFSDEGETFDPTEAVEFEPTDAPDELQGLQVGDVIVMRVSVCQ